MKYCFTSSSNVEDKHTKVNVATCRRKLVEVLSPVVEK